MSRLTIEEGAKITTLSHKWKKLWVYFPGIFNFDDSSSIVTIEDIDKLSRSYPETSSRFVSWVTHVVEQHLGPSIQEFKVIFDLDDGYQCQIDKWVVFALAKQAKSLVLDLNPEPLRKQIRDQMYTLPLKCCMPLHNLSSTKTKHGLKTLNLRHVNITTQVLDCFLCSCPFLENLHLRWSISLTSVRSASSSPLALKHLHVSICPKLEIIDILAPKLLTFYYNGDPIQLHLRNAFLLSEVTVGGNCNEEPIDYAFHALSEYYSQLKYLRVMTKLYTNEVATILQDLQLNVVIPPVSNLTRLKHLVLTIYARKTQSLLGWMTLLEASPVLQKITLELSTYSAIPGIPQPHTPRKCSSARPLECLKTLEVYGFVGRHVDLEFVTYVLENAIVLEQVILDFNGLDIFDPDLDLSFSMPVARRLRKKLPRGAELIINEWRNPIPRE